MPAGKPPKIVTSKKRIPGKPVTVHPVILPMAHMAPRFWLRWREFPKLVSPLFVEPDGTLRVDTANQLTLTKRGQPPLGVIVGECWWDEGGDVLRGEITLPDFEYLKKTYGG